MDGAAPQTGDLRELPIDLVDESPTNPRKRFDPVTLGELASSIRGKGLIAPVTVRLQGERYELVVGARRLRACRLADRPTILSLVRTLTDREVREIQLEENGQRVDVHPLEEADAYRALEALGAPLEELAARTGKSVDYVRQRMRYCALGASAREAFLDGKLTPATALLVARIPVPSLQAQATQEVLESRWQSAEPMTPRAAYEHIRGRYMLRLADAPFDRGDAALVLSAGPCATCSKRTGAQPELFADVESPDVCIDPDCFQAKKDADWKRRAEKTKSAGGTVLSEKDAKKVFPYGKSVSGGSGYVDLAEKPWEIGEGKKSYKGLLGKTNLPPVILARDPEGSARELVKKEDLKRALKAAGITCKSAALDSGALDSGAPGYQAKERERLAQQKLVVERALGAVASATEKRAPDLAVWQFFARSLTLSRYDVVALVAKRRGFDAKKKADPSGALETAIGKMAADECRGLVVELLAGYGCVYGNLSETMKDACKLLDVDLKKLESEVAAERNAPKKAKGKKAAASTAKAAAGKTKPAKKAARKGATVP